MPGRITELSESQIVADLGAELRRIRRALASSQLPTWTHDIFTAPATYQLTYIPYGVNVLADNGAALSEGTDYTVDYATGLITFTVARTSGHVIYVSYVTTGDLTALSGPVDAGTILDNFNRADSATTLNPASDGGTWLIENTTGGPNLVVGILSNQAYQPANGSSLDFYYRDLGSSSCDVSVTVSATHFPRLRLYFAWNPATHTGYMYDAVFNAQLYRVVSGTATSLGTLGVGVANGVVSNVTTRITYNATTGLFQPYVGGVAGPTTITDPTPLTGTCVGFGATQNYGSTGETWDNFSAVAL